MALQTAIEVENLSKRYRLGQNLGGYTTLRETLAARRRRDTSDDAYLWALRDISFSVPKDQALGLIGPNGAGKTTLLKVLARITQPTSGVSRTRGRAGALLDVGTGFHPELTGRENIYLNAAILGMSRRDVDPNPRGASLTGITSIHTSPMTSSGAPMRCRYDLGATIWICFKGSALAARSAAPAGYFDLLRMNAITSADCSGLSEPGSSAGIVVAIFSKSSPTDLPCHDLPNAGPVKAGKRSATPSRFSPWQDAHCSAYKAVPRLACASEYTPSFTDVPCAPTDA